ncbi:hypothetical protein EYC84_008489 [Monilinia fructicola]|uniref:Uncharacterized protein n=1 Tax=Monilinia fructicola TaxID=38448 RepID=A0A5M9JH54_MONFR|nr:hypothetical protein EYC84_008489 [Monilinia fructicola]
MSNQSQTTGWDSNLTLTEDAGAPATPAGNREAANNRPLGPGNPPEHPSLWEQRHAIIFDVGRGRLYIIDRSEIDGIRRSANSAPEYLARFNVDSLGLRGERLEGEIVECWYLDERDEAVKGKRSIRGLIAWRFRGFSFRRVAVDDHTGLEGRECEVNGSGHGYGVLGI